MARVLFVLLALAVLCLIAAHPAVAELKAECRTCIDGLKSQDAAYFETKCAAGSKTKIALRVRTRVSSTIEFQAV